MNQVTKGKWVVKDLLLLLVIQLFLPERITMLETQIFRSTIKAPRSTMISKAEGMHRVQANYNGRF